ncbi:hypothetical protein VN97_g7073 [Penicillium thymicola]|uniref:Uncharacterized protein n=1 Tax=Penicillium thymicola TaxID=293382 RepID=A0AAI9X761_PENTH|nr:hypothetical protein VN97_g7073 [Penicillium thymicola]
MRTIFSIAFPLSRRDSVLGSARLTDRLENPRNLVPYDIDSSHFLSPFLLKVLFFSLELEIHLYLVSLPSL